MKYEIVNPSDQVFIYSDNLINAACACMLLSNWYGLTNDKGEVVFPIFSGEEWFKEHGVNNLKQYIFDNRVEISTVLNSFEYPHKRTSLNNIGENCKSIAEALLKLTPEWVKTGK